MKSKSPQTSVHKTYFIIFLFILLFSISLALNSVQPYKNKAIEADPDLLIDQSEITETMPIETYIQPAPAPLPVVEPNYNGCNIKAELPPRDYDLLYEPFWQFKGYSTPYLFYGFLEHSETNIMYAQEDSGTDGIEQYVAIYCSPNTKGYSNEELLSEIRSYLDTTNYTEKNDMRPDGITIQSATTTKRWGYEVIDLTLELHYEDYEPLQHDVTIMTTPEFLYEVMVDGISQEPALVNQAKSIFNSLEFN